MTTLRLAVVRDFRAENWTSMDLCADQLLGGLRNIPEIAAVDVETPFRRRFGRLPRLSGSRAAFNGDRVYNRHFVLPRHVRSRADDFDAFHIVDHSYAHVALGLPRGRVGVYCHDLDAFRSILDPAAEPRPWWFRRLAARTLRGLQTAAVVFHNSREVGRQLADLVPADRLVHAPLGVAEEFRPDSEQPVDIPVSLETPFLLHVGSTIPRKRIDVLLDVFAKVRERQPGLRLIQIGDVWTAAQAQQIDRLGLAASLVQLRGLSREQLAEFYRRAALVLVPSEAEGFGLPVIEALACGACVLTSDIAVLRETGGAAILPCPLADVAAWSETILRVLADPAAAPSREARLAQAGRYSWRDHARTIADVYLRLGRL
jgi:glycosyltransferase involved in cell wall biosynthesis